MATKKKAVVVQKPADVRAILSGVVDVLDTLCPRESVHAIRTKELRADLREKIAAL
jgi:hypothetical protein